MLITDRTLLFPRPAILSTARVRENCFFVSRTSQAHTTKPARRVSRQFLPAPDGRTNLQNQVILDALRQAWQHGTGVNETEMQFSFTCTAPSVSGRCK